MWTTFVAQRAERDIVHAVASRTNLGIDLQTALQLVLVKLAKAGKAMFKDKTNPKFNDIRALFPIPSLTMHFVMSSKSSVKDFAGMEGKTILLGKGSFGAREGAKYLKLFGLEGKVKLAEVELSNAGPALKNGQIDKAKQNVLFALEIAPSFQRAQQVLLQSVDGGSN